MLDELQAKRGKLIIDAEKYESKRDEKNTEAGRWASTRDELNAKARELVENAQEFKKLREGYNKVVGENKLKRDQLNEGVNDIFAKIDSLRKKNGSETSRSLKDLKKEIDKLEFKQQTTVLSPDKERALVSKISELQDELEQRKSEFENNEELKAFLNDAQKLRDEASKYHDGLTENARLAQEYHERMGETFKEVDKVRSEADNAHAMFVKAQELADGQHKLFIKSMKEIRDFDKVIVTLRNKVRETEKNREKNAVKQRAEEIYTQFKKGGKLDTEDLLLLQRSRLI